MSVIDGEQLVGALTRLSILEEEIEDYLPRCKGELKRLKRRRASRRSRASLAVALGSTDNSTVEEEDPTSEQSSGATADEGSANWSLGELSLEEAEEEELEDEDIRRLTEEVHMLEKEMAALALDTYGTPESVEEQVDGEGEEGSGLDDVSEDEAGDIPSEGDSTFLEADAREEEVGDEEDEYTEPGDAEEEDERDEEDGEGSVEALNVRDDVEEIPDEETEDAEAEQERTDHGDACQADDEETDDDEEEEREGGHVGEGEDSPVDSTGEEEEEEEEEPVPPRRRLRKLADVRQRQKVEASVFSDDEQETDDTKEDDEVKDEEPKGTKKDDDDESDDETDDDGGGGDSDGDSNEGDAECEEGKDAHYIQDDDDDESTEDEGIELGKWLPKLDDGKARESSGHKGKHAQEDRRKGTKLQRKAGTTRTSCNEGEEGDEEEEERVHLWEGFSVPAKIWDGLYLYQRRGVEFMWSLLVKKTGGILGDEMGLGKTIQALVFVLGALTSGKAKRVLIVTPLSVMKNWENELMKWSEGGQMIESRGMGICFVHGPMNKKKKEVMDQVFYHGGGICFTTYGSIPPKLQSFLSINWDIALLDEGHKIKNHRIALSQAMRKVPSTTRILLTGTPIQNNLMELWSLFDYTCKGQLLGTIHQFGRQFEQPIRHATYKCASAEEKQLAHELSKHLRHILAPHFLCRTKADTFNTGKNAGTEDKQEQDAALEQQKQALSTRMNDFIVWVRLTELQERLYRSFLASDQVRNVLNTTQNVLEGLVALKKLCDHPCLLTEKNVRAVDATLLATCGWLLPTAGDDDSDAPTERTKTITNGQANSAVPCAGAVSSARQAKSATRLRVDEFNQRLPEGIKLLIFGFVSGLTDAPAAAKLRIVCKEWARVAGDDALWFPLCKHYALVDAQGRNRQKQALHRAAKREEQLAEQQAEEVRKMAYSIHPQEASPSLEQPASVVKDSCEEGDGEAQRHHLPGDEIPPPLECSWCEYFINKRRDNLLHMSAKLMFLMCLLPKLRSEGSRVLVFSQSRKMLNIIEMLLRQEQYTYLRIDGSVVKSSERQRRVELFNSDPSYFCFLLTTVVGGIGLNLTGADRVVIIDPSWNPTHDNQAVCRAFRLGQRKNVIVYRLITCASIEEKIYRRQVFKGAIVQNTITQKNSLRYFSREELADLFHLGDPGVSQTQRDLHALHAHQRTTDQYTDQHIGFLTKEVGIYGISDHDLLFSTTQAVESSVAAKQRAQMAVRSLHGDQEEEEHTPSLPEANVCVPANNSLEKQGAQAQDGVSHAALPTPAITPRRRPRQSIADTALNAFAPPVTVYSRVIERTRRRALASPAASPSAAQAKAPASGKAVRKKEMAAQDKENTAPSHTNARLFALQ